MNNKRFFQLGIILTYLLVSSVFSQNNVGDMLYWNGSQWESIPIGGHNTILTNVSTDKKPQWIKRPLGSMVDFDGNVYQTVVLGNQEWIVSNLRTTKYNDGTPIPNVTVDSIWANLTTGAYSFYWNSTDPATQQKYGALYNYYAVETGKLAPEGWRVPSDSDFTVLQNFLIENGYNFDDTDSLNRIGKSMAVGWWEYSTNLGAVGNNLSLNNRSGFSGIAAGYRSNHGHFGSISKNGCWWTSTVFNSTTAWYYALINFYPQLYRNRDFRKVFGFSVRLMRYLN